MNFSSSSSAAFGSSLPIPESAEPCLAGGGDSDLAVDTDVVVVVVVDAADDRAVDAARFFLTAAAATAIAAFLALALGRQGTTAPLPVDAIECRLSCVEYGRPGWNFCGVCGTAGCGG